MNLSRFIQKYYAIDQRALALMRIVLGCVAFCDLLIRCSDLNAFYSNEGMWPTRVMFNLGWQHGFWTIHGLLDSGIWLIAVFLLHLGLSVSLILGFKTRLSTLFVWLLYVSLHNRNVFILQSGDDLLRLILLIGLFLPWGNHYSIDSKKQQASVPFYPLANMAYLILIASVYLFTALLKTSAEWHSEGSAIYYALSLEQLRLPLLGDFIYRFPLLLKILTHMVYGIELILPFLILWPSVKLHNRWIAFGLILLLHLGIGSTLFVGLFFWISIAGAIALLPSYVMDKFEFRVFKQLSYQTTNHTHTQIVLAGANGFLAFVLFLSATVNLSSLTWFNFQLRGELLYVVNALRLNQYWGMFSPEVLKKDGWLVYHGVDKSGRQWDLYNNSDYVDYNKPAHIVNRYKNDRWRKLSENMQNENFLFLRHLYSNYYLKRWNNAHPEKQIATLNLFFMEQTTLANYKKTEAKKILYCVSTAP